MPSATIMAFRMERIAPARQGSEEAIAHYLCVEGRCMMDQVDLLSNQRTGLSTETYQAVLVQMDGMALLATVRPHRWDSCTR